MVLMVFLSCQDLALHVHRDLARQVALGHGRGHLGDVAHLAGEVRRHGIDRVGEILPGAGHAGHLRLTAELAFGAHLARHARHFRREAVELVHHRVDGFLQLEDFALHVHGDLARQVAARHGRGHLRDIAHLRREVGGHGVDRVGEILPGAGHARHHGLAAESAIGAHFARHARHFRGEGAQLVHHRVDGFLELQDFAAHVHGDLLGQVAVGHGDGHVGDVAHLRGEVAGHLVDGLGEFLPHARHALDLRLAAELAFRAHLARHARHFRGEHRELLDHGVDELGRAQEFTLQGATIHLQLHGLPEIALGHRADGARDFGGRSHQVVQQAIERIDLVRPRADGAGHRHALPQSSFLADRDAEARDLARDAILVRQRFVERLGDAPVDAIPMRGQAHREVAIAERDHGRIDLPRSRVRLGIDHKSRRVGGQGISRRFELETLGPGFAAHTRTH